MTAPASERAPLDERDTTERLSADDMATLHEGQLLQAALHRQRLAAARGAVGQPGVCSNCAAQCLPRAVYCDEDCRADHEARLQAMQRRGQRA